jgi:hypothetical protein
METVARVDGTRLDFPYEDYYRHSRPVIVTEVVARWPACEKWTQHYLRSVLADTPVPVGVARSKHFRLDPSRSELEHPRQMLPFDAYANYVEGGAGEEGPHYYLQRLPLSDYCPTLLADVPVPPFVAAERLTSQNLWFGPGGSCTALHWDDYDNAIAQIRGRKQFTLFAPDETQRLYPHPALSHAPHQSRVNIDDADPLKFPDFVRAERYSCVLEAGELLLLPACWWHQVTSVETSISVNYWWKADLDSLLASNVAHMMREVGRAGTLTVLQPFLANVHGSVSFMDAAIRAQQVGRHWMSVMLALAAIEAFVIAELRRIGLLQGRYVISVDVGKAGRQLLTGGVLTPDDLERLDAAVACAHRIREIPFEQASEADAQFMIDWAIALMKEPALD